MTNLIDIMFRRFTFNLRKGAKILKIIPVLIDRCASEHKNQNKGPQIEAKSN
ncbi:MAG: hypothetical protein K8R67_04105 [Desulfobacteraceae bacterium]|nr:hypothetical protein [Desulfobacteraceae bacterium]